MTASLTFGPAGPYASAILSRDDLGEVEARAGMKAIGPGPSGVNHRGAEISGVGARFAHGDHALVALGGDAPASHRGAVEHGIEGGAGVKTIAAVHFWRVDPPQAHPLAGEHQGVTVQRVGRPLDIRWPG